jgi:hypothetical protein
MSIVPPTTTASKSSGKIAAPDEDADLDTLNHELGDQP